MFTKLQKFEISALAIFAIFALASGASAATEWDDDFESYSAGAWTPAEGSVADFGACTRDLTVTTAQAHAGTKSLLADRTGTGANCTQMQWTNTAITDDDIIFSWWWRSTQWVAGVRTQFCDTDDDCIGVLANGGNVTLSGGTSIPGGTGLSANTWHQIEWRFNFTTGDQDARINGGSWSSPEDDGGTMDEIDQMYFWVAPGSNTTTYWDDIELLGSSLGDPRTAPVTTIYDAQILPLYNWGSVYVQIHALSNVFEADFPDEDDSTFEIRLYRDTVLQTTFTVTGRADSSFPDDPWLGYQSLLSYNFVPGDYDIDARACFVGFTCGAYSDPVSFTVLPQFGDPIGGGGGGSWSADDFTQGDLDDIGALWGGGYTDWNDFIGSYPDHDTLYGACDWWGSAAGDGLPCLWTWFAYAVFPDSTQFRNVISTPIGVLVTRWPFGYLVSPAQGFLNGLENGGNTCPIPPIFGTTILDLTVPEFDLCTAFDNADASAAIAANAYAANVLVVAVYILFAMLWFDMAKRFLRG